MHPGTSKRWYTRPKCHSSERRLVKTSGLQGLMSSQASCLCSIKETDCLFLDVYVPGAAVKNPSLKLPVIHWTYGGAYTFGGKDEFGNVLPFYDGTGLLQESGGNVIFVAANYRVSKRGYFLVELVPELMQSARCVRLARWDNNGKGRSPKRSAL